MSLEALIHPLGVRELLAAHWEQRAAYLPGPPDRFAELGVDRRAFASAAAASHRRAGTRWLKAQHIDDEGHHRERHAAADQIDELFAAGMTLCLTRIDDDIGSLAQLAARVKQALGLAGPVYCNAYLSPPGRGFGLHFDVQSVFILQLEGAKAWRYGATPAHVAPLENVLAEPWSLDRFHAAHPAESLEVPDLSGLEHQRLQPGDVLYVPPGCWHQTLADGPSLSVSLSCAPRSFSELITGRLHRTFRSQPDWRRSLPPVPAADIPAGALPASIEAFFAARLAGLRAAVDALDPGQLANQWLGYLATPRREPAVAPEAGAAPAPGDRFRVRGPLRFAIDVHADAEALFIHAPSGEVVMLPPETLPFVRELAAREAFTAREAAGWSGDDEPYAWDELRDALETLLDAGLIARER